MWNHYEIDGKRTHLFNIELCTNCGAEVEIPNGANGTVSDIPKYKRLGMTQRKRPNNEIIVMDNDEYACEKCC